MKRKDREMEEKGGWKEVDGKRVYVLDDSDQYKVLYSPICSKCKHLLSGIDETCDAFPDRIPYIIWGGENDHRKPFPGDRGIQFELKDTQSTQQAIIQNA